MTLTSSCFGRTTSTLIIAVGAATASCDWSAGSMVAPADAVPAFGPTGTAPIDPATNAATTTAMPPSRTRLMSPPSRSSLSADDDVAHRGTAEEDADRAARVDQVPGVLEDEVVGVPGGEVPSVVVTHQELVDDETCGLVDHRRRRGLVVERRRLTRIDHLVAHVHDPPPPVVTTVLTRTPTRSWNSVSVSTGRSMPGGGSTTTPPGSPGAPAECSSEFRSTAMATAVPSTAMAPTTSPATRT